MPPHALPSGRYTGWRPDLPDQRDWKYAVPKPFVAILPAVVDLSPWMPPVYDQGQLGSCTANAIAAAFEFDQRKQGITESFTPSRLFIYYNEREMEGTVSEDSGAFIRDGIKSVGKHGICPEDLAGDPPDEWPYVISRFWMRPPAPCYEYGKNHNALQYMRVNNEDPWQMKSCLAEGFPIVIGFSVYESFESPEVADTGVVSMPGSNERVLGGHAVLVIGYNDDTQRYIVRNSWGDKWGSSGYFYMPYEFFSNRDYADDAWSIRVVR